MLFAVDAATGEERWSFPAGRDNSSPAIAGGVVYSGSLDGNLYALDAQTGNELWHAPLGASASRAASVAGDLVYIGSDNGLLHAFDLATGEERWQIDTAGTIVGTPMIVDGVLYHGAGSDDNLQRIARDAATGDELWRWGIEGGGPTSIASVSEDRIYVGGSDGNIYALDAATGTEEWRFSAGSPAGSTVTLAGGVVYATTEDGNLYGVDAETGLEVFRFSIGGRQNYGPAILDGVAYVGNHLGVLYAIGGSEELLIQAPAAAASPEASPEAGAVISAEFLWETGENLTIQSYDADGHPGVSWGGRGTGDGQFLEASDIAIDPAGNLHVVDVQRGDVQKFSPNGEYLLTVGGPATPLGPGVGVDGDGNIYAPSGTQVHKFSPDGNLLMTFGNDGSSEGQLANAVDIAVDDAGNIYVSDDQNNQIKVYDPSGTYVASIGSFGAEPGQLIEPGSLAWGDGLLYVADWGNQRLQVFSVTIPPAPEESTPVA